MKKAGLVSSLRGAQGGYILSKKPSLLTVAEILEALEGPSLPAAGMNGHSPSRGLSRTEQLLAKVWDRVNAAQRDVLQGITVEELASQQRQLEQQRSLMYHI
ncbi:hypothetical protein W02_26850 [Nitrospira sp. KM1]|nr:hypothetical protein W02_26850 [Nitrospira sp. KM1]